MHKVDQDEVTTGAFSLVGNACLLALNVLPGILLYALYFSPLPHTLSIYYATMILAPTIFIIVSGSLDAYAKIFAQEIANFSKGALARVGVAFVLGFVVENIANLVITRHTAWWIWRTTVWEVPGNLFFVIVNPIMETFFWRIFLHREMAVRFFPAKRDPGAEDLLTLLTQRPTTPRLSQLGMLVNGLAFGLYHYVPLVIFDLPVYGSVGITYWNMVSFIVYLCMFGFGAVYMREQRHWGIIAALALHTGVDAENILAYTFIMDVRQKSKLSSLVSYRHTWAP